MSLRHILQPMILALFFDIEFHEDTDFLGFGIVDFLRKGNPCPRNHHSL
jgi:hypothetical protein